MSRLRVVLLAVVLGLVALPSAARAADLTPNWNGLGFSYTVAMGGAVSTVTVDAAPGGGFRVTETGDTLTLKAPTGGCSPSPQQSCVPCTQASAGNPVTCTQIPISGAISVTNSGGSTTPPTRDKIIAAGSAHGDPQSTWSPVNLSVSTSSLIEVWLGDAGGNGAGGVVTGSDIAVGTADQPADIVHTGTVPCGSIIACDLKAGADRFDGGPGKDRVAGGDGDDTLLGGAGDDQIDGGNGNDFIRGGKNKDTITGGAGTDTIAFDDPDRTTGLTATFTAGTAGKLGDATYDNNDGTLGESGSLDSYDNAVEKLVGTDQADTLTGGAGVDSLSGAGGDDLLDGKGGPDVLDGGAGTDTITYADRTNAVNVNLSNGTGGNAADDGIGDALANIENITGGAGNDTLAAGAASAILKGNGGNDSLTGGAGDDTLDGGAGADTLDGGAGTDAVSYAGRSTGVTVTVNDGNGNDGEPGEGDTVTNVESITGTDHNDTLTGSGANETLDGGAGDDLLDGRGGADALKGGTGTDTVSYATANGVSASLASKSGPDGDTFDGIENLTGSPGDDTLTGDDSVNRLDGGAGNDTLVGNLGADDFFGGDGADTLKARDGVRDNVDCGAGTDTIDVDDTDLTKDCDQAAPPAPDADKDGFPDALDCAPNDPAIHPGAVEIPGNAVDENCDKVLGQFSAIANAIRNTIAVTRTYATVKKLTVVKAGPANTIKLSCKAPKKSKACAFKTKTVKPKKVADVNLASLFKKRKLPPGTTITLVVTGKDQIGKKLVYLIRKAKDTKITSTCVDPAGKGIKCP